MIDEYFSLALDLSVAMIKNGGETYRAEECARNILAAGGAQEIEVLALPTGITITAGYNGKNITRVRSLKMRINNLGNIDSINTISREVSAGKMQPAEAISALQKIEGSQRSIFRRIIFASLTSGMFTLMFGGSYTEFALALVIAFFAQLFIAQLKRIGTVAFLSNMGGSILTALTARLFLLIFPEISISVIIIGGIMPMLPGLATINAIRDTLYGDLVSGAARGIEALLSAIAIAAGVGIVLAV